MPRYVVQRTFADGLHILVTDGGAELCERVVECNAEEGVTWISSFVSEDKTRTFLHLRRTEPGGDSQDSSSQWAAGRPDHPRDGARSLLLRLTHSTQDEGGNHAQSHSAHIDRRRGDRRRERVIDGVRRGHRRRRPGLAASCLSLVESDATPACRALAIRDGGRKTVREHARRACGAYRASSESRASYRGVLIGPLPMGRRRDRRRRDGCAAGRRGRGGERVASSACPPCDHGLSG